MPYPLAISHLSKSFGRKVAVADLSLTVEAGSIHGLLGPNGSGKSTTLRCALGLLRPDAGSAEVLGQPARKLARLRGKLGVAFDRPDLLESASVLANLDYARRLSGLAKSSQAVELLEQVGLSEQLRQRAGTLSLGQKRRLAIARALLGKPELVILDEPLSGLDSLGVRDMLELFRQLRTQGTTLVLSSHRLHEMETVVDHVSIMSRGRLVSDQPLEELLAGRGRIRIVVGDAKLAQNILSERSMAVTNTGDGLFQIEFDSDGEDCANLNALLVQNGCPVHGLARERASLGSVFEELVASPDEVTA